MAGDSRSLLDRFEHASLQLRTRGQDHLLRWWPELSDSQRRDLLGEIESIPWAELDGLISTHVLARPSSAIPQSIRPAPVVRPPRDETDPAWVEARARGVTLLQQGKIAAFTVAGGQGTRLGFDGPKGMVPVTPVGEKSLFELFAQTVLAARRRYTADIPWYIMTSPANHAATVGFMRQNNYFGLTESSVCLFPQGMLPAFDFRGKALLSSKSSLALAPDGHGGSLKALVRSGAIQELKRREIMVLSYFQVDNPLVKPFDPLFIGLHAITGSEMSTKVATKVDDLEKVGNVCLADGKVTVVEYSDFPEQLARARDESGGRLFDAGNLAIHLLDVAFVDRIVSQSFGLPFRRAEKVVPFLDECGILQRPENPNAVKLETFVFDVLPRARNPLVMQVERGEEFSPVKNAIGVDSLETSRRDQVLRACRWLEAAGIAVPRNGAGEPALSVWISPLFAMDADEISMKKQRIPQLQPGMQLCLE
jgi:UDP-N-acetylglucosamine/UDP-N-acetylgalactosamine diphosphorylase